MNKILLCVFFFTINAFSANSTSTQYLSGSKNKISKKVFDTNEELIKELEGIKDAKTDLQLYSEIVSDYQLGKYNRLSIRLNLFAKKFANSLYIDNAYYLAGKLALEQKNYLDALNYFQKVISKYPLSNKVVSAKFGKAMAYKKMNLDTQAVNVLNDIKKKYPFSPEFYRAEAEIKLVK